MKKTMIVIAALALLSGCCGCCGGGGSSKASSDSTVTVTNNGKTTVYDDMPETKFSGTSYNNAYVMDINCGGTHYRMFNSSSSLASGGPFVVNVTLDSLRQQALLEQTNDGAGRTE